MVQVEEQLQVLLEQVVLAVEEMDDVVQQLQEIQLVNQEIILQQVQHKEKMVEMVIPLQEIEEEQVVVQQQLVVMLNVVLIVLEVLVEQVHLQFQV